MDIIYVDVAGISALIAAEHGGISIQGYTDLHIHVPFSGKVIIVSGRYNFKKLPIQDILLGSDLHIKHLMWLSLPPFDIGYTSAIKAPLFTNKMIVKLNLFLK